MPLYQTLVIEIILEHLEGSLKFPNGAEGPNPQQVFLQRSDESSRRTHCPQGSETPRLLSSVSTIFR